MAHAVMLERCGLITAGEKEALLSGLPGSFDEVLQSDFSIGKEFEDIHSWWRYAWVIWQGKERV
jgi:argininosuccinate lyase